MDLLALSKRIREELTPADLSELRLELAGEYAYLNSQLIEILKDKPLVWQSIRYGGECKSDTAAEREWQRTQDAQKETLLRMELKTIDKLSSAIKRSEERRVG